MATYKHIRSSTANKRPTTAIADGQIAINTNTASPGLFFKDSAGTGIVKVGPVHVGTSAPNASPAAGGSTGNYTGEQWLDTSLTPAQLKVWNGSQWIGVVADELPVSKLQDGAARQLLQTDAAGTGVEWTSNVDVPGTLDVTGATTLDSTLTLPLGSAAAPTVRFTGDTNTGIYSPGADQLALSTSGVGRVFVDASGNVSVGGNIAGGRNLTQYVRLNGDTSANYVQGVSSAGNAKPLVIEADAESSSVQIKTNTANAILFAPGETEKARITSNGFVGIGTTSPSQVLHVAGSSLSTTFAGQLIGDANERLRLGYRTGGPGTGLSCSQVVSDTTNLYLASRDTASGNIVFHTGTAVTEKARIDSSGRLLVGTSSDSGGALLQVNGNRIRVATAKTPASASDTGTTGEICWDASYIYVCTATNTWKRAALSAW